MTNKSGVESTTNLLINVHFYNALVLQPLLSKHSCVNGCETEMYATIDAIENVRALCARAIKNWK